MKISALVTAFMLSSCAIVAQSKNPNAPNSASKEAFIYLTELNVERYNLLFKILEQDKNFEIVTACIPAHVIHISWLNSPINNRESVLRKFNSLAGQCDLKEIKYMDHWGVREFEGECLAARNSQKR
jgi:hypothetical protein